MIRKIHLDFHTHPETPAVGSGFDPEEFADTLARAEVNYLATPGKCQYGLTYFDTKVGHPHPNLVRGDLFPETVRACVERGIKVQAYFGLGLDDVTALNHPDWRQTFRDGAFASWDTGHLCFASPYTREVVIPEVLEMIERCPGICGFWFDICLYVDGAFYSPYFNKLAEERLGSDSGDETKRWQLGREIIRERCIEIDSAIHARMPEAENYFNSLVIPGEPQNLPLQPYHEIENPVLFGGCEGMTVGLRWLRLHQAPSIGLASRFMAAWMDSGTIRTEDQMRFDVGRAVSLGSHPSMGDHRHPDGRLEPEVYTRLAPVYSDVKQCEPWLDGAKPCREAVLLSEVERGTPRILPELSPLTSHAGRILEEIGLQFDIATVEDEIPEGTLVIWPGEQPATPELAARLKRHIESGGSLVAMGDAIVGKLAEELFGAKVIEEDVKNLFFRMEPEMMLGDFSHEVGAPTRIIEAAEGVRSLASLYPSLSTNMPAVGREPVGPAIILNDRVIYSAAPLIAENALTASPFPRKILGWLCDCMLGRRLVRHNAGTSVAVHLHRAKEGYTLHLLHWAIERWSKQPNPVAEFPLLGPIDIELTIPEPVKSVTLEPSGEKIDFAWSDGVCGLRVPGMKVWQVIGVRT